MDTQQLDISFLAQSGDIYIYISSELIPLQRWKTIAILRLYGENREFIAITRIMQLDVADVAIFGRPNSF